MLALASDIHDNVSGLIRSYSADKDRLKSAMEQLEYQAHASKAGTLGGGGGSGPGSNVALIASLRQSLNQAMQQNSVLRAKLQKIHLDSDVSEIPTVSHTRQIMNIHSISTSLLFSMLTL